MKLHSIGFTVEKNDQIVKHGIKHSISAIQNDPSKIAFTYILRVEFSKHVHSRYYFHEVISYL